MNLLVLQNYVRGGLANHYCTMLLTGVDSIKNTWLLTSQYQQKLCNDAFKLGINVKKNTNTLLKILDVI